MAGSDEHELVSESEREEGSESEDEEEEEEDEEEGVSDVDDEGDVDDPSPSSSSAMPLEKRLEAFEKDQAAGMEAWQAGDIEKALDHWAMARGSLKYVIDKELLKDDPDKLEKVRSDQHRMHLNLARGFLTTGEFRQTIEYAGRALTYDARSEKALYRMSVAHKELSHFSEARDWLWKLLDAHPDNAAGKQLLQEVARLEKASEKSAKKVAKSIFQGLSQDHDPRSEAFEDEDGGGLAARLVAALDCCRRRRGGKEE